MHVWQSAAFKRVSCLRPHVSFVALYDIELIRVLSFFPIQLAVSPPDRFNCRVGHSYLLFVRVVIHFFSVMSVF